MYGKEVTWSSVALLLVPLLSHARVCVFTSSLKHNLSFRLSLVWGSICKLHISMNLMLISNLLLPWLVPYIWGRRYSWWFLHAALFVVLSSFRPISVMSLLHASFHLRFGRPLILFPGISTSSILLTMCSSFILLTWWQFLMATCKQLSCNESVENTMSLLENTTVSFIFKNL